MWILLADLILFGILISLIIGYFGGFALKGNDYVKLNHHTTHIVSHVMKAAKEVKEKYEDEGKKFQIKMTPIHLKEAAKEKQYYKAYEINIVTNDEETKKEAVKDIVERLKKTLSSNNSQMHAAPDKPIFSISYLDSKSAICDINVHKWGFFGRFNFYMGGKVVGKYKNDTSLFFDYSGSYEKGFRFKNRLASICMGSSCGMCVSVIGGDVKLGNIKMVNKVNLSFGGDSNVNIDGIIVNEFDYDMGMGGNGKYVISGVLVNNMEVKEGDNSYFEMSNSVINKLELSDGYNNKYIFKKNWIKEFYIVPAGLINSKLFVEGGKIERLLVNSTYLRGQTTIVLSGVEIGEIVFNNRLDRNIRIKVINSNIGKIYFANLFYTKNIDIEGSTIGEFEVHYGWKSSCGGRSKITFVNSTLLTEPKIHKNVKVVYKNTTVGKGKFVGKFNFNIDFSMYIPIFKKLSNVKCGSSVPSRNVSSSSGSSSTDQKNETGKVQIGSGAVIYYDTDKGIIKIEAAKNYYLPF